MRLNFEAFLCLGRKSTAMSFVQCFFFLLYVFFEFSQFFSGLIDWPGRKSHSTIFFSINLSRVSTTSTAVITYANSYDDSTSASPETKGNFSINWFVIQFERLNNFGKAAFQ